MDGKHRQHKLAYAYAMVAVLFWATSASAFKLSQRHVQDLPLLFLASATSTVIFGIYLTAAQRLHLLRTLTHKDLLWSAGLGFLNPFLYYAILFKAYSLLPAQEAQPINFVWPLTLVLLSIPLLGQRIKPASILAIFISFTGVVVIATRPERPSDILDFRFSSGLGVLLALSTTVVWALFWIYNTRDRCDEAVRLFLNFAFATGYTFIAVLLTDQVDVPVWQGLIGGVYIGLFEMGITFLAWLKALKLARTTAHVVNLIYLVPFLSLLVIALVLDEQILPATLVGLVLIIAGIVLQKRWA
ncbi:MAG: DMT family transporter [Sedimentisphaerales bacterium]|jgi:drug/metabolite transporter (DMT)-like permease|nr:DMT family transporter [Sedimentisphaerales bacterium]HNY76663.1 DMT family transporter [Sedimentisphaerales bacterium]HOC61730.1 DMT family transporter [Sedimentisphaerales bacterium]HOH62562.1 DMT family transporter [Sedimentisphaerales bacterium]HQA88455.1 DMT family transporter [Sedimentisphaerales bacterium]